MGSLNSRVRKVEGKEDSVEFIRFPWRVNRDNPYRVPPLISERKAFLDPWMNPFSEHSEVDLFLAQRDSERIGTIAAIINDNHNAFHEEKAGFFGLFEVIKDYTVAKGLLTTARDWVKARSMCVIRGPMNMSINDECCLFGRWVRLQPGSDDDL